VKEKVEFSNGENKVVTLNVKHFSLYAVTFKVVASETPVTPTTPATPATPTTPATPAAPTTQVAAAPSAAQGENKPAPAPAAGEAKETLPNTGVEDVTPGIIGGILAALGGLGLAIPKKGKRD